MALIPGSYARLAGLQSEISKVTVTRVAGNEVQYRRTIDTYQRDLRYQVNQIGREQKLLRKSMKKYTKKLLDSKRERKQRQAKAKEDSDRLKRRAQEFLEAEEAVRHNVLIVNASAIPLTYQDEIDKMSKSDILSEDLQEQALSQFPVSPDSGIESEADDMSFPVSEVHTDDMIDETKALKTQKAFLTSNKGKLPYFKAKRGHGHSKREDRHDHTLLQSSDEDNSLVETDNGEDMLPVINEENEENVDQQKTSTNLAQTVAHPKHGEHPSKDLDNHIPYSQLKSKTGKLKDVVAATLNTKIPFHPGDAVPDRDRETETNPGPENDGIAAVSPDSVVRRKRGPRKPDVSYGDLVKLQHTHTSSTKQLFDIVDRLASVHGVVIPARITNSMRSSSLDPRTNKKMKHKRRGSGMFGGMAKQAAVLYPIKHGYDPNHGFAQNQHSYTLSGSVDPNPFVRSVESLGETAETTETDEVEDVPYSHTKRSSLGNVLDSVSQTDPHSRSTARRGSMDVTSQFYEFGEGASSLFDNLLPDNVPPALLLQERRTSRSKGKPLTLSQMSEQVTKIRERSLQAPHHSVQNTDYVIEQRLGQHTSLPTPQHNSQNTKAQRRLLGQHTDTAEGDSSPGRHRGRRASQAHPTGRCASRSLSQRRRSSVQEQLDRRLNPDSEPGSTAWQSAFGRLKMLHTLFDLTHHFS